MKFSLFFIINELSNGGLMFGIADIEAMSNQLFTRFSSYINRQIGIHMPESKRFMLQSRLQRRVRELSLPSYEAYYDLLSNSDANGEEGRIFINLVTTNKTDFFREKKHFDYMERHQLPKLMDQGLKKYKIWSAACSSGEEPYTMAMVLDHFRLQNGGPDYQIYASDISTAVLAKAEKGIYRAEVVTPIPDELRSRYFLAGSSERDFYYKVKDTVRDKVQFARQNLMDDEYRAPRDLDAVFCRNVLIYFEKEIKVEIISKLISHLKPGGILFLGHTETIFGMNLPLNPLAPAVYEKI